MYVATEQPVLLLQPEEEAEIKKKKRLRNSPNGNGARQTRLGLAHIPRFYIFLRCVAAGCCALQPGTASGVMRSSSSTSGRRRTSSGSSGSLGPVASKAGESVESGSSAVDLAELLEKKDLSAAEVMVIRQSMVQVCDRCVM